MEGRPSSHGCYQLSLVFSRKENSGRWGDTNRVPSAHREVRQFFLLGLIISIGDCNRFGMRNLIII